MSWNAMRCGLIAYYPSYMEHPLPDTRLHCLLPLFDMLYTDRDGELWYFDEDGVLRHKLFSRRGIRQGCVLGIFIFCITVAPIYKSLRNELGPKGCCSRTPTMFIYMAHR